MLMLNIIFQKNLTIFVVEMFDNLVSLYFNTLLSYCHKFTFFLYFKAQSLDFIRSSHLYNTRIAIGTGQHCDNRRHFPFIAKFYISVYILLSCDIWIQVNHSQSLLKNKALLKLKNNKILLVEQSSSFFCVFIIAQ